MKISVQAYPWDVAAVGAKAVVDELAGLGVSGINLAATYHPIAALCSRVPGKLMYCEQGAVFFPARAERYGRIKPRLWPDRKVLDAWPAVAAGRGGMELTAWTIALFQPWMAGQFPDCARMLPSGEPVPAGVCPSAPDVAEYLESLAADAADQFAVSAVDLEGVGHPAFDYGWVRPRVLVRLGAWEKRLLGLCFCTHCVRNAAAEGIDAEGLRARVNAELARGFERDEDQPGEDRYREWMDRDPEFVRFFALRGATARTLIGRVAKAVKAQAVPVELGVGEADLAACGGLEGLPVTTVRTAGRVSARRAERLRAMKAARPGLQIKHTLLCGNEAGMGLQAPLHTPSEVLASLAGSGVDEVSIYNYGLISRRELLTAVDAVRAL